MDLQLYSAIVSTAAVVLILLEWTYVVLWTRKIGPRILAGITNSLVNLRAGRGKGSTAVERIADAAAEAPPTGQDGSGGLEIPDALIKRAAAAFGVSEDTARMYAKEFLGGAPAGGPPDVFQKIAERISSGKPLTPEEKKTGMAMLFRQFAQGAGQSAVPPPGQGNGGDSQMGSAGGGWT